jgi:hypothetical protein
MTTNETVTVKPLADIAAEWIRKAQELMAENADLRTLADTQARIINEKNDEIAELTAALSECDRRNEEDAIYAPALEDVEADEDRDYYASIAGANDDAIIKPPDNFAANGWG